MLVVDMAKVLAGPLHVALFATTLIEPELWSTLITIVFVVETPDQPPGKVQVYDVALATEAATYVFKLFNPTAVGPVIDAGAAGTVKTAPTVALVARPSQPSVVLAVTLCDPEATPVNTGETW